MLIGIDMKTEQTSFSQQSPVILFTLIFLVLLLVFGMIFNTIGILVFSKKKSRQVGCDLYLLNLTIISQIGLIPSLFDWFTVCISMERAYVVIKDVRFTKVVARKTLKVSPWIILVVFLWNILSTLHRPFYLRLSDEQTMNDELRGHPWCVLDLPSTSWNIYEKSITLCHLVVPFMLNLFSIIGFIFYKTKLQLTSITKENQDSTLAVIRKQISKYKPIVISPTVILILEIPRFVLTFTLACIDHDWQRYVYLVGYLHLNITEIQRTTANNDQKNISQIFVTK